ncbi:MAG: double-strand break repair helicase AddA [Rhizomicrobium sp.]
MSDASLNASDPTRSAWVAANAGAGKTHTLANRVTRLLLADAKPERILCLTYTKAAAAEMQDRLFNQLGRWSMLPDTELATNIESIGAEAKDAKSLRKARRLFAQALETPGGLKIQTIHAFCQNLLARFPIEAGVPPSAQVLDDRTARDLMSTARMRVLERAASGDAARAAAIAYIVTQTSESRLKTLLDAALGGDRRKIERFFHTHSGDAMAITREIRRAHGAGPDDTEGSIAESFVASLDRAKLSEIVAWQNGGGKGDVERAQTLGSAMQTDDPRGAFDLFRNALCTGKRERVKNLAVKKIADARPDLLQALEDICDLFLDADERMRAVQAAALCEATLVVADAVREVYATEKRVRGALDYDDLIARTVELLDRHDAAWVLYKLDGGLDHVLVDEAQDTSPEQWLIVRQLTNEFFSREGRHGEPRTVFVVGDEKQSIFSFQGADPKQFDVNREYFRNKIEGASHHFADESLATSRRSAPQILRFVDAVFAPDEARAGLTSQGAVIAHKALRETARGRVELWPTIKPSAAPEPDVWRPVDQPSVISPVVQLAIKIAEEIKQWTDGKTRLPGHDDAIRPGDIMILLPRREPFGSEIIRRLKERGIAVAGADRIRLNEQIAVMDLIALGRFALLPEDDLNLAALLRSPLVGLSEKELFDLAYGRTGHLWAQLAQKRGDFAAAFEFLGEMRSRADQIPPFEFYAHALGTRGMQTKLLARLGVEANDAIDEFLSLALAYESANTPSLEGFLHWIERGGAEVKRDMERGRDEVRVMTVHGAKGLEADIVILPDTTGVPGPGSDSGLLYEDDGFLYPATKIDAPKPVQVAKDAAKRRMLEERRRLLYVALTRAKDRLIVCGFETKKGVSPDSWYVLAERAAKDICTETERDGETILALGDDLERGTPQAQTSAAEKTALPGWIRAKAPLEFAAPRLIRPSEASGDDEPPTHSPRDDKRFRRGLLVHALLARLPEIAPEDRRDIALKFLNAQRDVTDADSIADETLRVLNDPQFAAAFAPGSRAEAGLVADLPELGLGARINGRIDRLAVTDDEVLIVDFKTNRPPPAREEDLAQIYRTQMALYRAGATKIFPGRRIACALVWTEGPRLMKLSDALLDAELARIAARLKAR